MNWFDVAVFGRGEDLIIPVIESLPNEYENESVLYPETFSVDRQYSIAQATKPYPRELTLEERGKKFREGEIGCPHKCYFCGYSWQRRYVGSGSYKSGQGLFSKDNRERAMLDLIKQPPATWNDEGQLRIIGLDGISERLRLMCNKRITRESFRTFLSGLATINPPHQIKIYNIVGYPTETDEDYEEFIQDLKEVDRHLLPGKQWSIVLHCTPFRAMPATPAACWPMSYRNYRGQPARVMGKMRYKGNIFYQGNRFWAVEGMGTDSLSTVILSAICHRGVESDAQNVRKVATSNAYWRANSRTKQATLEKYFDVATLFGAFTWETLPTRYLTTYAQVEKVCR
jgi:radical SAM superfamily enzyme YgiQ (UPF0313 family)